MRGLFSLAPESPPPKKDAKRKSGSKIDIDKLKECLKQSLESIGQINSKKDELVMIVGLTGAGKSSVINYLLGWDLGPDKNNLNGRRFLELLDTDKNRQRLVGWDLKSKIAKTSGLKFLDFDSKENEVRLKKQLIFAPMGIGFKSATKFSTAYRSDGVDFAYCDCPGFGDSRGTEQEAAGMISNVLAAKSAKAVKAILVLVDGASLDAARGRMLIVLIETLHGFIKFSKTNAQEILDSVFFVFNKTRLTKDQVIARLEEGSRDSSEPDVQEVFEFISQEKNKHRIIIVNPHDKGETKQTILKMVAQTKEVDQGHFGFPTNSIQLKQFEDEFLVAIASKGDNLLDRLYSTLPKLIRDRTVKIEEAEVTIKQNHDVLHIAENETEDQKATQHFVNLIQANAQKIVELKERITRLKAGVNIYLFATLPDKKEERLKYKNTYIFNDNQIYYVHGDGEAQFLKIKVRKNGRLRPKYIDDFQSSNTNELFKLKHKEDYLIHLTDAKELSFAWSVIMDSQQYRRDYGDVPRTSILDFFRKKQEDSPLTKTTELLVNPLAQRGLDYLQNKVAKIDHDDPILYNTQIFDGSQLSWWQSLTSNFRGINHQFDCSFGRTFVAWEKTTPSGKLSNIEVDYKQGDFKATYTTNPGEDVKCEVHFFIKSKEVAKNKVKIQVYKKYIDSLETEINGVTEQIKDFLNLNKTLQENIGDRSQQIKLAKANIVAANKLIEQCQLDIKEAQKDIEDTVSQLVSPENKENFDLLLQLAQRIEFEPDIIADFARQYSNYRKTQTPAVSEDSKADEADTEKESRNIESSTKGVITQEPEAEQTITKYGELEEALRRKLMRRSEKNDSEKDHKQFLDTLLSWAQRQFATLTAKQAETSQDLTDDKVVVGKPPNPADVASTLFASTTTTTTMATTTTSATAGSTSTPSTSTVLSQSDSTVETSTVKPA